MSSFNDAFFNSKYNKYLNHMSKEELKNFMHKLNTLVPNEEVTSDIIHLLYNGVKTCYVLNYGCERTFKELTELLDTSPHDESKLFSREDVFTLIIYHFLLVRGEATEVEEVIKVNNMEKKVKVEDYPDDSQEEVGSWDEYFYNVAQQAARNAKCFSRKIGAVLVKDKSIIGTGYNGPPRGIDKCDARWGVDLSIGNAPTNYVVGKCPRKVLGKKSGEAIDLCPASHAEESAIVNSARMGISTKDAIMYLTCGIPCCKCAVKIINAGISEVVVTKLSYYDDLSKYLFNNSAVKIRLYSFLEKK